MAYIRWLRDVRGHSHHAHGARRGRRRGAAGAGGRGGRLVLGATQLRNRGFGAPNDFPAGDHPTSIAVGNFNGDANPDLAVANFDSNNVSILLGDGSGGFGAPSNFGAGPGPSSLVVGTFDADADADLAIASESTGTVRILLGQGTGSFVAWANLAVGSAPRSIAVGNFDANPNLDLAVANSGSDDVSILLGNDDGTFSGGPTPPGGLDPRSIAVGNFNADSIPDLAVANFTAFSVAILLGDGNGGFGPAISVPAGADPTSVAVGNFNGGSRDDLAIANGIGLVSILLGMAEPTISTATTTATTIGSPISATATIADGASPGGAITFRAYGPDDETCSEPPAFTSAPVPVSGNGGYASPDFIPADLGTYRWVASYSGDGDNTSAASACNAPNSTSTVAKAASETTISSSASSITAGEPLTLTATVDGFQPGGEVVFRDGGATLGSAPLDGSGRATLSTAALAAGAHEVVARYAGDANNDSSESALLTLGVERRPPPARPSCPQVSPAPSNYTPARKLKTRQAQIPGVRARIAVAAASQLEIEAQLRFKRNGRSRSAELGTHSLGNPGTRNLRLPLPASLRRTLPLGTKVTLKLKIAASTGCGQPQLTARTIRTRVVKVLAG